MRRACWVGLVLVAVLASHAGPPLIAQAPEPGAIALFSETGGIDGREKTLTVCGNGNVRLSERGASNIESRIDRSQVEHLIRLCGGEFASLQERYGREGAVSDGVTVSITCSSGANVKRVQTLTGGTPPPAFFDLAATLDRIVVSVRTTAKTGLLEIVEARLLEPWPFGASVSLVGTDRHVPVSEDLFTRLAARTDHDRRDLHREVFYVEKGLVYRVDSRKGDRRGEFFFDTHRMETTSWPADLALPLVPGTDSVVLDEAAYSKARRFLASVYERPDAYDTFLIDGIPEAGNRAFRVRIITGTRPTKNLCSQP